MPGKVIRGYMRHVSCIVSVCGRYLIQCAFVLEGFLNNESENEGKLELLEKGYARNIVKFTKYALRRCSNAMMKSKLVVDSV